MDPIVKHLKIKSAAVKRLQKEYESYEIEEKRQHSKVETLKQEGVDQYELKKQNEFLQETQAVLPGCKIRLQDTLNEIVTWLNENGDNLAISNSDERKAADEIIESALAFLEHLNTLN